MQCTTIPKPKQLGKRILQKFDICLGITWHPCDNLHASFCNNRALPKAVKRCVCEGETAKLVGAPDADILLEAIEMLRKRTTAGAATFLVNTCIYVYIYIYTYIYIYMCVYIYILYLSGKSALRRTCK